MRFLRSGIIILLLFPFFLGAARLTAAAEPVRVVKVGAYNNKPKIYKDVNDRAAGIFADILNYIAEKENWQLEYVFGRWDEGLNRLAKGEVDLMVDVAVSTERKQQFDFTQETVLNSYAVIYVRKDSAIDSIMDLEGKKISILKSSVYVGGEEGINQYLEAFGIKAEINEVNDYRTALDLLELGKVDAAIVSHIYGLVNEKDYKNIQATKIFLKPTELKFALTKGDKDNPYLIERLDFWVAKLKAGEDNFLVGSLKRHGLLELEPYLMTQKPEGGIPDWVCPAVGGISAAAIILWGLTIFKLRRSGKKLSPLLGIKK